MSDFLHDEMMNKLSYNQLDPCTLSDAKDSLTQMPDDILADSTNTDYDDFDRKDFEHEFNQLFEHYGGDYFVKDLIA